MVEFVTAKKSYPVDPSKFSSALEALKSMNLLSEYVGYKLNGEIKDLHMPLPTEGKLELFTLTTAEGRDIIRHTSAHVLAQAVKALYPSAQVTIGPVIDDGFFYDFAWKEGFSENDFAKIEEKIKEIVKARYPLRREVWPSAKAIEYFLNIGEKYKAEIIRDLNQPEVSVYWQGEDFVDLCRGPHLPSTGQIPAIKLTKTAGAYWRGDEKNEMLSRIYGTAWESREAMKEYLDRLEEAKKRDHRRIGTDLGLFSFHPEAPAAPFFHPPGAYIYSRLQDFIRDLNRKNDFQDVVSPLIMSTEMWKTSGHYDNYKENMYFTEIDEKDFAVKPMNCPGHCLIYKTTKLSYRDLPLRMAEFGRVHRHERSGVVAGLFRVRSFVQDDAHIYCSEDQVESEIVRVLRMIDFTYKTFGFEYRVELSTRPAKRIGDDKVWDKAEAALKNALEKQGQEYQLNPGDGAFYGPKIDFHLKDSIGRTHQCGTIQLDFQMPERFGLKFKGADNADHTPVMIHRAIVGSFERFFGILIEHLAGRFPAWLAPQQAVVMTAATEADAYAQEISAKLKGLALRVQLDDSSDKLGAKVRKFQALKVPYMLVVGAREAEARTLSVRTLDGNQETISLDAFTERLRAEAQLPVHVS